MTTATDSPSAAPSSNKPRARTNVGRLLVILLLAAGVLWWSGALKPKPRVVLVAGESPYFELVISGAREAARQYDADLTVIRAKGDVQADAIRNLIGKKYDGAAVSPFNPITEAPILAQLGAEMTLVTFDSDSPLSNRLCFVGTNNYEAGRLCGQQVRQALNDAGGEVIISSATLDKENGQRRRQGLIDELLDRSTVPDREMDPIDAGPLKGPHYTVVTTLIDASGEDAIVDAVLKALAQNPNVKCLVGLNNYGAPRMVTPERPAIRVRDQIVGPGEKQLEKRRCVGLAVAEDQVDRRRNPDQWPADQRSRQKIHRVHRQQGDAPCRGDQ